MWLAASFYLYRFHGAIVWRWNLIVASTALHTPTNQKSNVFWFNLFSGGYGLHGFEQIIFFF